MDEFDRILIAFGRLKEQMNILKDDIIKEIDKKEIIKKKDLILIIEDEITNSIKDLNDDYNEKFNNIDIKDEILAKIEEIKQEIPKDFIKLAEFTENINKLEEKINKIQLIKPKDGLTPIKGVDYFDGKDGEPGRQGDPGKPGENATIIDFEIGKVSSVSPLDKPEVKLKKKKDKYEFEFKIPRGLSGGSSSNSAWGPSDYNQTDPTKSDYIKNKPDQMIFIQDTRPVTTSEKYEWWDTSNGDLTLWIEDGS